MKKLALILVCFVLASPALASDVMDALKTLPVQDSGRIKPFDTFARESLHLVYGKKKYRPEKGQKRSAVDVVTTWMLIPDYWNEVDVIEIRHNGLREALKIDNESKKVLFSPKQILSNERLTLLFQELKSKREAEEKLNPYYQAIQRLQNQITVFHMIRTGMGVRVAPNPSSENQTWLSVAELRGAQAEAFSGITRAITKAIAEDPKGSSYSGGR